MILYKNGSKSKKNEKQSKECFALVSCFIFVWQKHG